MRSSVSDKAVLFLCGLALSVGCTSKPSSPVPTVSSEIVGAGSTFVSPIMRCWINKYQQSNRQVQINYYAVGSGEGIQQLRKGSVDFAAIDAPLSDDQLKDMPVVIQLPESAGPVCITYNLPGLQQPLKLRPATLASIYLGKIRNWHHLVIDKDNPGVELPKSQVVVAHRTDASGTTSIFATYLDTVSPEWHRTVGRGISITWPVGVGRRGSEGVTGFVRDIEGSIGYAELAYASHYRLPVAKLCNRAGKWISPDPQATSAAIAAFKDELSEDIRTPIINPPANAPNAYPISGLTYLLIPRKPRDAKKGQYLKEFVRYILTEGQGLSDDLHYGRLPPELQDLSRCLLGQATERKMAY